MLAAVIAEHDATALSIRQVPEPTLPPGGALLRVSGCGVCGSDLDKLRHAKAPAGTVLGHEVVGVIQALSPESPGPFAVGDRVVTSHHVPCLTCHYCQSGSESMCRQFKATNLTPGGFAQVLALSAGHLRHTAFKIPDGITDAEASCVEPLACVLRAVRRSLSPEGFRPHQPSVAIVGLGFIGLLAAQQYRNLGFRVYGLDLSPERLGFAESHGFVDSCATPGAIEPAQWLAETPLGRVDTVFITAVNAATLRQAFELVRDGGNVVLFSSAAGAMLDPDILYFREINVVTSYSPALQDLRAASEMIFNRQIQVEPLVTHRFALTDIHQALAAYGSGQALKALIDFSLEVSP